MHALGGDPRYALWILGGFVPTTLGAWSLSPSLLRDHSMGLVDDFPSNRPVLPENAGAILHGYALLSHGGREDWF